MSVRDFNTGGGPRAKVSRGATNAGERRWDPRVPEGAGGVITYNGARCSTSCRVLDISSGGARIELDLDDWMNPLSSSRSLPSQFKVLVTALGFEADCWVAWRDKSQIGVKFIGKVRPLPRQFRKRRAFGGN